jgi:hypothetical protein
VKLLLAKSTNAAMMALVKIGSIVVECRIVIKQKSDVGFQTNCGKSLAIYETSGSMSLSIDELSRQ